MLYEAVSVCRGSRVTQHCCRMSLRTLKKGFLCDVVQLVSLLEQYCPVENKMAEFALFLTD